MPEVHVSVELPVLDLSQPVDLSFLPSLSQACQEWGFFYVTNHGISKNLFSKVYSFFKHIFSLPPDSKLNLGPSSCLRTYTPHFIATPYFESLIMSGPDSFASAKRSAEFFSQQNPEISKILQEYGNKMIKLSKKVIEVLLMTLGDGCDRKLCESEFSKCHGYFRIVNYSPPKDVEEKEVEGLGMHTDMSYITIVNQDDTGGLPMRSKEGDVLDICPCEDSLVVNIGDLMQAWSNGGLRSSENRVVLNHF